MFGRKKKKENTVLSHSVLGEMSFDSFLHTVQAYDITLFERTFTVYLYVNSVDFKEKCEFNKEQEKTIDFFVTSIKLIEKKIEEQLMLFYGNSDASIFKENISLENISISNDGELAFFFNANFSDEELLNVVSDTYFIESFGIVIFPEEHILYDEEECYKFDK